MKNNNQIIQIDDLNFSLFIKREDLIDPLVSGNKFRKLKYNLLQAQKGEFKKILTFGGAFSNHIAAVAAAGKKNNIETIGIIRGEELVNKINENPTLLFAQQCGMTLSFISRENYRNKAETWFNDQLLEQWGDFYLIPEGGTNELAIKGCEEILTEEDNDFDYICCPVGTGGTISGIINSAKPHQKILGFPALKGGFLSQEICKFAKYDNWELISEYHFGGYGKVNKALILFINQFYKKNNILLDPIYTGKMVFGVLDLIQKKYFPNGSRILIIHTGGIQGILGMNIKLKNKNLTIINTND